MNRINLNVPFSFKDKAKAIAAAAGTKISWDGKAKTWYWQGNGELPECLNSYRNGTKESYARSEISWNQFQSSKAGDNYKQRQDELAASEFGYESVADMKKADAEFEAAQAAAAELVEDEDLSEFGYRD